MNEIEQAVKRSNSKITRVQLTPAGLVVEADGRGREREYMYAVYDAALRAAQNFDETIYAIHLFRNKEERFNTSAILHTRRSERMFNMSTTTTGVDDVHCLFTQFDYDVLMLSDAGERFVAMFIVHPSFSKVKPRVRFYELEIQGSQIPIDAYATPKDDYFEVSIETPGGSAL